MAQTHRKLIRDVNTPIVSAGNDKRLACIVAANSTAQQQEIEFYLFAPGESDSAVANLLIGKVTIEPHGTFAWERHEPIIIHAGSTIVAVAGADNVVNVHLTLE